MVEMMIFPICERCSMPIRDLTVLCSEIETPKGIYIIREINPASCPNCNMPINKIEVDSIKKTVTVKER